MRTWAVRLSVALVVALFVSLWMARRDQAVLRDDTEKLRADVNHLAQENARLSSEVLNARNIQAPANPNQDFSELLKLRGEVALLRKEVATLKAPSQQKTSIAEREPELAATLARSKLRYAEELLKQAETKFKVGVVSTTEFENARFDFEIAQAELANDPARVRQLKLEQAEKNLAAAEVSHRYARISKLEYERVKFERDLAAAESNQNPLEIARVKFEAAESKLRNIETLRQAGLVSEPEYLRAELERDIASAEYATSSKQSQ